MDVRKITERNENDFFSEAKVGEVFTYSQSFFPETVKGIAEKKGVKVEYCAPGSSEYKAHGCHTMVVVPNPISEEGIQKRIDEILSDSRMSAKTAVVFSNAPLALIQTSMESELHTLQKVLGVELTNIKELRGES